MAKLLLLIIIGFIIYFLIRGYAKRLPEQGGEPKISKPEDMVRCSHCGVHLPRGESILANGKFYCGEEHRRAGSGVER